MFYMRKLNIALVAHDSRKKRPNFSNYLNRM